jgi:hypothetical protein
MRICSKQLLDPVILTKYFQREVIAAEEVVIVAGKFSDKV